MRTGTVIVGAGQAGLALSRHLTARGHPHILLERGRAGERWRSERWDSLALLTPNRLNRLPGEPAPADPDSFQPARAFVQRLETYARSFAAPVREDTEVTTVERTDAGFLVRAGRLRWRAGAVVVATGDCGAPAVPALAREVPPGIGQLHSSAYTRPAALAPGGVLVVGAGPSGQQIARELRLAGRDVVLAAGRHARSPMRYRGRDIWHWLEALGDLDRRVEELPDPEAARRTPSLALSGADGGADIDLGVLDHLGIAITGRLEGFDRGVARLADDLPHQVGDAERRLARLLGRIDGHADRHGAVPADPVRPVALPPAPRALDLAARTIRTVIWATGFRRAYPWLDVPEALDDGGELVQRHGITPVPGLAALGLRFQRTRRSHFIGGVGADARLLAAGIVAGPRRETAGRRRALPSAAGLR